jgi:hypothetical protein
MFGLESQSKKKNEEPFFFDLENDAKDPNKYSKIRDKIQQRLLRIKSLLRSGSGQEDFDHLGNLVFGYTALLKVLNKAHAPKKR